MAFHSRREEAMALVERALKVALDNGLSASALRAYNNLGAFLFIVDRLEEARANLTSALELARRVGNRGWECAVLAGIAYRAR